MITVNGWGDIVSGSLVQFPNEPERFIVGEVFTNNTCLLYNNRGKCIGTFTLQEIGDFIV